MRVFGYSRVSTGVQASSGDSLDTQHQQISGYAMMRGWEVAETFVERGVSGCVPLAVRPEGGRLLAGIVNGDAVVTPELDRMFRSAADAQATLAAVKGQGVSLHMIDLGGDVTGNGFGKLTFTILPSPRMSATASGSTFATSSANSPSRAFTVAASGISAMTSCSARRQTSRPVWSRTRKSKPYWRRCGSAERPAIAITRAASRSERTRKP